VASIASIPSIGRRQTVGYIVWIPSKKPLSLAQTVTGLVAATLIIVRLALVILKSLLWKLLD
jgi:hypothetical protein